MNSRLSLTAFKDYMTPLLPDVHVGTVLDANFMGLFAKTKPAVWIVGQRLRPVNDGRGHSGVARQTVRVEIIVRIVIGKDPVTDIVDANLTDLQNDVMDCLFNWKPPGAARPLVWDLGQDGPPNEGTVTADLIFITEVVYEKVRS